MKNDWDKPKIVLVVVTVIVLGAAIAMNYGVL